MKPITVVGSYNVGLTMRVSHLPREGETVLGNGYSEAPGGKGSNQAIAARRLGAKVNFVGCVGTDRFGDDALGLWTREGVGVEFVKRSPAHTGVGFVLVDGTGANAIAVDPGANFELTAADVKRAAPAIYESGALLTQLEISPRTVDAATRAAKARNLKVILNPAPSSGARGADLKAVDILTPNEQEFEELSGTKDLEVGGRRLLLMGPSAVVVTRGRKGAHVFNGGKSYSVPAPPVKVVDTTGAGDAFNGALAVALLEGEPLRQAVAFANQAGALSVTEREVVPSLPTRSRLERFRRQKSPRTS